MGTTKIEIFNHQNNHLRGLDYSDRGNCLGTERLTVSFRTKILPLA